MKRLLLLVSFFAVIFTAQNVNAQGNRKLKTQPVNYGDNVEAPFTARELSMLKEVYQDKLEEYVLSKPQKAKDLKHLLRNRIEIKRNSELINYIDKYELLSKQGLFNYYNSNLTYDKNFNPSNFNVLKYNLQFFGNGTNIYRIDNTDYFIYIKSQF